MDQPEETYFHADYLMSKPHWIWPLILKSVFGYLLKLPISIRLGQEIIYMKVRSLMIKFVHDKRFTCNKQQAKRKTTLEGHSAIFSLKTKKPKKLKFDNKIRFSNKNLAETTWFIFVTLLSIFLNLSIRTS
jgi:hypothetical protein